MTTVDIFCQVIDNFGDIGVCWRLARQLQQQYDYQVRLWVDDLASFAHLAQGLNPSLSQQTLDGLNIWHWTDALIAQAQPAQLVIEGFACRLPEPYLVAMAQQQPPSTWLNLEYLTAETWALDCHGLSSRHPRLPLQQSFFFPSFSAKGGGLLREQGLIQQRDYFQQNHLPQQQFWQQLGYPQALEFDRRVSLFGYENSAVSSLLQTLAEDSQRTLAIIPHNRLLNSINQHLGLQLRTGDYYTYGHLQLAVLPFLSHQHYDHLLWACDLNAVRGEDSLVRALWAGRPLLWHIYPQQEDAHWPKLNAWLALMEHDLPKTWLQAQRVWNLGLHETSVWQSLFQDWPRIVCGSQQISHKFSQMPDLADRLVKFCQR